MSTGATVTGKLLEVTNEQFKEKPISEYTANSDYWSHFKFEKTGFAFELKRLNSKGEHYSTWYYDCKLTCHHCNEEFTLSKLNYNTNIVARHLFKKHRISKPIRYSDYIKEKNEPSST